MIFTSKATNFELLRFNKFITISLNKLLKKIQKAKSYDIYKVTHLIKPALRRVILIIDYDPTVDDNRYELKYNYEDLLEEEIESFELRVKKFDNMVSDFNTLLINVAKRCRILFDKPKIKQVKDGIVQYIYYIK